MKSIIYTFIIIFFCHCLKAQQNDSINTQIVSNIFKEFAQHQKHNREFLKPKKTFISKINPLTYVSGALLYVYQNLVSEQIQANCQYQRSCSENMKTDIKNKGFLIGVLSGLNQLGNCMNSVTNDYPYYKITSEGKINNTIE